MDSDTMVKGFFFEILFWTNGQLLVCIAVRLEEDYL